MTTKKKPELKCVCGKQRSPVYTKGGDLVGHFCKYCGSFEAWNAEFAPVLWEELSEDSLEDARNLLDANEGTKYDMIIREMCRYDKRSINCKK